MASAAEQRQPPIEPYRKGLASSMKILHRLPIALALATLLPTAAQAADCHLELGFATLAAAVPQVGQCTETVRFARNGDAQQHTSGGLLAWRKADNWTAFTDGYRTWVNGPNGIQQRLNTETFSWETAPAPTPTPAPAPPPPSAMIPWGDVDGRLQAANYGGPYDHAKAEGQAFANGCLCQIQWNAAGVTSMGPSAPQPVYVPVYVPPTSINCTTFGSGSMSFTNCY